MDTQPQLCFQISMLGPQFNFAAAAETFGVSEQTIRQWQGKPMTPEMVELVEFVRAAFMCPLDEPNGIELLSRHVGMAFHAMASPSRAQLGFEKPTPERPVSAIKNWNACTVASALIDQQSSIASAKVNTSKATAMERLDYFYGRLYGAIAKRRSIRCEQLLCEASADQHCKQFAAPTVFKKLHQDVRLAHLCHLSAGKGHPTVVSPCQH